MMTEVQPDTIPEPWTRMRELTAARDADRLLAYVRELEPAETVRAMLRLAADEQQELLQLLEPGHAADIIEDLPHDYAAELIEMLTVDRAADIVEELTSDHGADLLSELDVQDAEAILEEMVPESATRVRKLISYPEDVAGGLMGTEHYAYPATARISDLLDDLQRRRGELGYLPQRILLLDPAQRLVGAVEIADVLLGGPEARLVELSEPVVSVPVDAPLYDLEAYFDRYETLGAPVVNANGQLVGRLRRRALFDALAERAQEDQLKSQGIVGGEELRTMPFVKRSRRRLSWLSINILLNIVAASVIALYQDTVSAVIALAVFLPIVSDMSGCSGNQAVAVSMRELTLGIVQPRDVFRVWWQEAVVGIVNGIALGSLLALAAYLWQGSAVLGIVVGLALCINTLVAVSIGGTVPLLLKRWRADPAVASGPVLTTVTDMCGFFLVLGLATLALPWLA
jgi:magnesium transporter